MQVRSSFAGFRAAAMLLGVPALLAAQSAATNSHKIHPSKDAVYITIDVPDATATYALGISDTGKIVGMYRSEPVTDPYTFAYVNQKGFLLEGDRFTDIVYPMPAGPIQMTCPVKINAEGTVVGWWVSQPPFRSVEDGFLWKDGAFSDVKYNGPLPPDGDLTVTQITEVTGINSKGDMAGQLVYLKNLDDWNGSHGWFYDKSKDQFQFFDVPDGSWTIPHDINDRGEIVGSYQRGEQGLGFLRKKDGSFQDIVVPADWEAQSQSATAINSRGIIVGSYGKDNLPHGFILNGGEYTPFDFPGAMASMPYGINAAGVIVGVYLSSDMAVHGYVRIPYAPLRPGLR